VVICTLPTPGATFKQILKQYGEAFFENPPTLSSTLSNVLKPLLKAFTLYPKLS